MNLILIGYMGSGKSTIGVELAKILNYEFVDLDDYIEKQEELTISEIFKTKGEVHFRKLEQQYLKQITTEVNKTIISLGGGTPCFYDTMTWLNKLTTAKTIYLKTSIDNLVKRLFTDNKRPLISHIETKEELKDFIAKHLFERSFFYNQSELIVDSVDGVEASIEKILVKLL